MPDLFTLDELKAQLNVTFNTDDDLLQRKLDAAVAFTEGFCGELTDPVPAPVREAVMMLAGHLYENREATASGNAVQSVPLGYDDLISPYREWAF